MTQTVTLYAIKLVFVQKITFVLRKVSEKLLSPELHFLTQCTKSFVGFAPYSTEGSLQRSPRRFSCI